MLLTSEDDSHHDLPEMSGATQPLTWHHMPEDLSLQVYAFCI
jgi:hypothetical protein